MIVRAGTNYWNRGGSTRRISKIIIHPRFQTYDYDIALIKVAQPWQFTESIKPIAMTSTPPSVGTCVIVSGWGHLTQGGVSPMHLHHVDVIILDFNVCAHAYRGLTPRMICAGTPYGGKDACQADSGGPLVVGDKLVGIVSWGYGCAQKHYPGVYANVYVLRNWVMSQINMK
ncbi:hypothetical protein ANN_03196 [Periplaneta americana]|uniref:Peptidase S1 domain-containing protein n=2 Tax=Periplaneta americana TaxID=6978 RepID=A0ABQ8U129_PERAM|nr:hypothetical protein ANN_03196 [Periplaneta americana]